MKVTYYALVNEHTTRHEPARVFRRTSPDDSDGSLDEAFGDASLVFGLSGDLRHAEEGQIPGDLIEIGEAEADSIIERRRGRASAER